MFSTEVGNHHVILEHLGGGLWRTRICGPHTADFQNVYASVDLAKADAAVFAGMKFRVWQIPVPRNCRGVAGADAGQVRASPTFSARATGVTAHLEVVAEATIPIYPRELLLADCGETRIS